MIRDSVVIARNGTAISNGNAPMTVDVENDTVIAEGAHAVAIGIGGFAGSTIFNVVNTISRGDEHDLTDSASSGATIQINSGLTGTLDLSGLTRTLGPPPDIGAYEYAAAPVASTGVGIVNVWSALSEEPN